MKHSLHNSMTKGEYIFGACYLVAQQFVIPFLLVFFTALLKLRISNLWMNFIFFIINFVVVLAAFSRYLMQNIRIFLNRFWRVCGIVFLGFVIYWAANILVSMFIMIYFPAFHNANDANIQAMASQQYWVMFTGSVILVPIVEETLYRGVIFGLADRFSRPVAYIASTLLFALIHVVGYIGTQPPVYLLVSLLQYAPAGLCLSWAYARSRTIFAPILIHTAVNLLGMLAMR